MAENSTKIKLMKLYEILRTEADEDHPISRSELCKKVNDQGIPCHIRTISRDIATLNDCGYEVSSFMRDHEKYYYVPERDFSIPELKIMIDAIQAASFVTEKKSAELIDRIAALGGSYRADLLKRNMAYFNSRKHSNESILYNVDGIEEAIQKRKKLAFHYFDLNEKKERVYRTKDTGEKKRYYVEPIALVLNEDNYYLMAYSSRHPETTANYRVDRMDHVEVVEESVLSEQALAKLEGVAAYTEQAFKMYSGEMSDVMLQFDRSLIGPVLDKFGEQTPMMPVNDTTCAATVHIRKSPVFFGWIFQFGEKMQIVSPKDLIEEYEAMLRGVASSVGKEPHEDRDH